MKTVSLKNRIVYEGRDGRYVQQIILLGGNGKYRGWYRASDYDPAYDTEVSRVFELQSDAELFLEWQRKRRPLYDFVCEEY